MSQESMPFFESAEAATRHACEASGKGYKSIGKALWPEKDPEAAATALRNSLNPNRDERLTADQHVFIANHLQRFDFLYYIAFRCSHSRPKLETPEERREETMAAAIGLLTQLKPLIAQLDQITGGAVRTA